MQSMTGFGRAEIEEDGRTLSVEIKTVNHRYLDINPRMPRLLSFLEDTARKTIKSRLLRGRVDVFFNYQTSRNDTKQVDINLPVILGYLEAAKTINDQTGIDNDITMAKVFSLPETVKVQDAGEDEEALSALLKAALNKALDMLTQARKKEGESLKADIAKRLQTLKGLTERIEAKEDTVVAEYKEKLQARLSELIEASELDESRFNTEVAFFADKCNITEEVVRLKSHFASFETDLEKEGALGRQFDFLVQELNREFNTIGSKSSDIEITNHVLAAKAEIEKIREQIQNIE
ncbi:MAG: YicC/YloC family endoribonuclease [Eubacteriales bacterium]